MNKEIAISVEDQFNRRIKRLSEEDQITSSVYSALRSTGALPARLHGLAKVHKNGIPLRPVVSLPGSCYEKINKSTANLFSHMSGAKIETSTADINTSLIQKKLKDTEDVSSLDVKSLYSNVPVNEAIVIDVNAL